MDTVEVRLGEGLFFGLLGMAYLMLPDVLPAGVARLGRDVL